MEIDDLKQLEIFLESEESAKNFLDKTFPFVKNEEKTKFQKRWVITENFSLAFLQKTDLKNLLISKRLKMKTALIVAPHPDDAELAMGGAIAKMITDGIDVIVVDLTNGEPTPFGSKQIRAKETQEASEILGIKKRICLDYNPFCL